MESREALKELSDAIHELSGEFDKPTTADNADKWLRLDEAQKVAKGLLEYDTLYKLAKRSGWRIPAPSDQMPKHSWVNFWRQMIEYEKNPDTGRPVVPHRTGSGYR